MGQMRVVLLECGNWEMCFSSVVADLTYDCDIKTDYIRVMLDCTMRLSIELENFQILKSKGLVFAQF